MFDLNRRKLLIGSLISGIAVSAPSLAFAEDRYQVLVQLQQDVIDVLAQCKVPGLAHNADIGYEAKAELYHAALRDRDVMRSLGEGQYHALQQTVFGAQNYMRDTMRAEWNMRGGDEKVDVLLKYLLTTFNRSDMNDPAVRQSVHDLMRGKVQINTLNANQLRLIEDAVVSIAVVKALLSYHRAPINTGKLDSFHQFATQYRSLILN